MNTGGFKSEPSILVTGRNGFIANNFVRLSHYKNCRTVSLRNANVKELDFSGTDVVFHLAALVHNKGIPEDAYYKVNRDLSIELALAAKKSGVKHFVFMSTVKVYGDGSSDIIFDEDSICNPSDFYGKSKLEAERFLQKMADESFCISIIRTPVVYGIGMKANMLRLKNLIKYSPVVPFGAINNKRCFAYVENLVKYVDRIIELRAGGIFIAMDNEPLSTTDLINLFAECMQRKVLVIAPPGIINTLLKSISKRNYERLNGSFVLNNAKTRKMLSFEPPFSTKEGICRMFRGY